MPLPDLPTLTRSHHSDFSHGDVSGLLLNLTGVNNAALNLVSEARAFLSVERIGIVGSGVAMRLASVDKARLFSQRAGCNNLYSHQQRQQTSLTAHIFTHAGFCRNVIQIQGRGRVVNTSFFILPAIDLGKDFGT